MVLLLPLAVLQVQCVVLRRFEVHSIVMSHVLQHITLLELVHQAIQERAMSATGFTSGLFDGAAEII